MEEGNRRAVLTITMLYPGWGSISHFVSVLGSGAAVKLTNAELLLESELLLCNVSEIKLKRKVIRASKKADTHTTSRRRRILFRVITCSYVKGDLMKMYLSIEIMLILRDEAAQEKVVRKNHSIQMFKASFGFSTFKV